MINSRAKTWLGSVLGQSKPQVQVKPVDPATAKGGDMSETDRLALMHGGPGEGLWREMMRGMMSGGSWSVLDPNNAGNVFSPGSRELLPEAQRSKKDGDGKAGEPDKPNPKQALADQFARRRAIIADLLEGKRP